VELQINILSKISQIQKEKYCMFSLICGKKINDLKIEEEVLGKGKGSKGRGREKDDRREGDMDKT
jgi:hypothetical protein